MERGHPGAGLSSLCQRQPTQHSAAPVGGPTHGAVLLLVLVWRSPDTPTPPCCSRAPEPPRAPARCRRTAGRPWRQTSPPALPCAPATGRGSRRRRAAAAAAADPPPAAGAGGARGARGLQAAGAAPGGGGWGCASAGERPERDKAPGCRRSCPTRGTAGPVAEGGGQWAVGAPGPRRGRGRGRGRCRGGRRTVEDAPAQLCCEVEHLVHHLAHARTQLLAGMLPRRAPAEGGAGAGRVSHPDAHAR
jgi:hypothetical protein